MMSKKPAPKQERCEEPEELLPQAGEEVYEPEGLNPGQRRWLAAQSRPDDLVDRLRRLGVPAANAVHAVVDGEEMAYCKLCRQCTKVSGCPLLASLDR